MIAHNFKIMSTTIVATLVFLVTILIQNSSGFYQGSDGTPLGFTFEPLSFFIGLGGGTIAVGIPTIAYAATHRRPGKIRGSEQCDDKNTEIAARFGDKRPIKMVKDQGNGNIIKPESGSPPGDSPMTPGAPIKGISVKGGRGGGGNIGANSDKIAGNPIGGISIKGGGSNIPKITGDLAVTGNPIGGLTIKGGSNKPPATASRTSSSGNIDPAGDNPGPASVDASNPVPGIGIIVKKCPGSPGCPNETTSVAGNPIGGLTIKGGSNKPPSSDDAAIPGNPIKGISVKSGGINRPSAFADRSVGSGTSDPSIDSPDAASTDSSK